MGVRLGFSDMKSTSKLLKSRFDLCTGREGGTGGERGREGQEGEGGRDRKGEGGGEKGCFRSKP